MQLELTKQDLNVLFESVEVWEKEDRGPGMMGHILSGMIGEKSPEAAEKMQKEMEGRQKKADNERQSRKERGVILRAKLIMLRDQIDAVEFLNSAQS